MLEKLDAHYKGAKEGLEFKFMIRVSSFRAWKCMNYCTWEQSVSSVIQSCPTFCDPMDCSMPGFLVHHQLPELAQTHVHWVHDAIQPFHTLSSLYLPAFNLSQHQGLFQWVSFFAWGGQSIGVSVSASVLPMNFFFLILIFIFSIYFYYIYGI